MDNLITALQRLNFLELTKDTEYIIMTNNYYISVDIPSRYITIEHYDIDRNIKYYVPKYADFSETKTFIQVVLDQEECYSILALSIERENIYTTYNNSGYTDTTCSNSSYTQYV